MYLKVNSNEITTSEAVLVSKNSKLFVNIKYVLNELNSVYSFMQSDNRAIIDFGQKHFEINTLASTYKINGDEYQLEDIPYYENSNLMVPANFINMLNFKVTTDNTLNEVKADYIGFEFQNITVNKLKNLTTKKSGSSLAVLNYDIVTIGGHNYNLENKVLSNEKYTIGDLNQWDIQSNMPKERWGTNSATLSKRIYFTGGIVDGEMSNKVDEYYLTANRWTEKATMTGKRAGHSTVAYQDKLFVIGGYDGSKYLNLVQSYNLTTKVWETKKSLPLSITNAAVTLLGDKIYIIGGQNSSSKALNSIYEYDISKDMWTKKIDLPYATAFSSAVNYNGYILILGGWNNGYQKNITLYDKISNDVISIGELSDARHSLASVCFENKIYIAGGENDKLGQVDTFEELSLGFTK